MNESTNDADTKIVLPIICPGCGNEINLAVDFTLLAPKEKTPNIDLEEDSLTDEQV